MIATVSEKKLKNLIKEGLREALKIEFMKLRAFALPEVLGKEQKDIEKRYGRPSGKREKSYIMKV